MLRIAFISIVGLFPLPLAVGLLVLGPGDPGVHAQELTENRASGAVLLSNGRVLVGEIQNRADGLAVRLSKNATVSVPPDQVEHVSADVAGIYEFKRKSIKRWEIGDHFQMTRWCMQNGLSEFAADHYQKVAASAPDHPRVRQLAIELKRHILEDPGFREYLGLEPETSPETVASATAPSGAAQSLSDSVQTASAQITIAARHPEIAQHFSQRIQPILLNRCSQAACHGGQSQNRLRLLTPFRSAYERTSSSNLESVLEFVSADSADLSPLVKYATTAHGIQREPGISITETQLLTEISNWIQFIQNPVTNAAYNAAVGGGAASPGRSVTPIAAYAPAVQLVPVQPGASGLKPVPGQNGTQVVAFPNDDAPTLGEIDALDRQLRQILGEPPLPTNQEAANSPARGPAQSDPFDPAEFNRQRK